MSEYHNNVDPVDSESSAPQLECAAAVILRNIACESAAQAKLSEEQYRTLYPDYEDVCSVEPTDCAVCDSTVIYSGFSDRVVAPNCNNSGSCEAFWSRRYPEHYLDPYGKPAIGALPCANCCVVVELTEGDEAGQLKIRQHGECEVDLAGERFRKRGRKEFRKLDSGAYLTAPEAGIEVFDGEANRSDLSLEIID